MFKSLLLSILLILGTIYKGLPQSSIKESIPFYSYHPPSEDKESWRRLNLWLSSTYLLVIRQGQADQDVCLLKASRSLGLSRLSILAEGIDDPELTGQSGWIDQLKPSEGIRILSQTKGKQHIESLILLGAYYAFQPNNYRLYKDSVEYFLRQAINEAKSLHEKGLERQAKCLLTKMYFQANEVEKGDSIFIPLIKECKADNDRETEARVVAYRGIYEPFLPATALKKLSDLQKAAVLYQELKDTEGEINMLTDVGYLLVIMNRAKEAYDVLINALMLEESINYPYVHYNTDILAFTTVNLRRFGEQLKYALRTVKTAEATRDSIGWGSFYQRMGYLYGFASRDKEAQQWTDKAIDRFILDQNPTVYTTIHPQIDPWKQKDYYQAFLDRAMYVSSKVPAITPLDQSLYHEALAGCYIGLRNFDLAELHLAKADSLETIMESLRGKFSKRRLDLRRVAIYIVKGKFHDARLLLEKYLQNSSASDALGEDNFVYQSLIYLDSAQGDLKAGMAHYKKYMALKNTAFEMAQVRQAEELEVMYETDEKEKKIALLHQQALFEQANLKQATLVKNLTIAGIVAALIIAGLLYRQSRLRKKNNIVVIHKNEQLQHLLTEKEWLLKEIHHRVKNNLQIVMSLLNSQSAYIDNELALTAIHDSQHRVHAMSLIHQKLYSSENISFIDISFYIRELVSYLADSFNTGQRIRFEHEKIESLDMDVSQAVPLGLILNEAITNAIKYAFPNDRSGLIIISLSNISENRYLLSIKDNGIGMPIYMNTKKPGSLGMSLMAGLSEDLEGNFTIENNNGTTIKITFNHHPIVKKYDSLTTTFVSKN